MLWLNSVRDNFKGQVPVEEFLQTYLPATEDGDTIIKIVKESATKLKVAGDKARTATLEKEYAPSLIEYLETVVSDFPKDTKPGFCDTSHVSFPPIDPAEHKTSPDIAVTRPGQPIPKDPRTLRWSDMGTVLELKLKVDMFKNNEIGPSDESQKALIQIAKSARSLLASGYCFVFVVAVIKTKARILRFDRAGYRTTDAFDWTESTNVIPRFFWRLYNPDRADAQPARIYGEDETISIPTPAEKKSMYKIWRTTSSYKNTPEDKRLSFKDATEHSRWVKARKDDKDVLCFTIGPPLSQSDGLFSRATRVDRVLIKDDPTPTAYALKDAWRQLCRRPEKDFYDVIATYCSKLDPPPAGMAQCLGSVRLPEHTTNSAHNKNQDRCHMRSLITPVGIQLKDFPSSKALILALEAAVKHHQIAYEAGVMHRDVSEGNVMFDEETMKGFLVDWDYAEFTAKGKERFETWFPERAQDDDNKLYASIDKSLKDLTGTFVFMAIQILEDQVVHEPKHDLESFYYLLIWMILRHTPSDSQVDKPRACHLLFDNPAQAPLKKDWVGKPSPFVDGSPLYDIADAFRELVMQQNPSKQAAQQSRIKLNAVSLVAAAPPAHDITYDSVLDTFQQGLELPGWPIDDRAIPFIPHRTKDDDSAVKVKTKESNHMHRTALTNAQNEPSKKSNKRRREDDGVAAAASVPAPSLKASGATSKSATEAGGSAESTPKKPKMDVKKDTVKSRMKKKERS
ncbi:hypothetical protein DFH06DRAFT_1117110 [Mycena polygramma]|nr:hypothetical protein DFH06DRAFT_1117110 [Mycena polygramma]